MNVVRNLLMWCALAVAFACAPATAQHSHPVGDEQQIVALLRSTFDRPNAPLSVTPVVVAGEHAIAGWVQENRGGRALMRRIKGAWTIHLCSGDQLKHAEMLESTGIPAPTAKSLAASLAAAERQLPPATIALFSTFEGIVHIGPDGHHPPIHHGDKLHSGHHK